MTQGKEVSDIDLGEPGDFEYFYKDEAIVGMVYACPCGCGRQGALSFRPSAPPSWSWNGDREKPTLSPSVDHRGHWHGYLEAGKWRKC